MDPMTGQLAWTPTSADVGRHDITISVSDGRGGTAQQDYTLVVLATIINRPPVIISSPLVSLRKSELSLPSSCSGPRR